MKMLTSLMLAVVLLGCGNDKTKSSESRQNVSSIYASNSIDVKVYYEEGAEPYIDSTTANSYTSSISIKLWTVLETNLEALFQGRTSSPLITVPKELSQMTKISKSEKNTWSIDDVIELSRKHTAASAQGTSTFFIYFLNGHAQENSNIIGFHISNTKVMAIFKDVIRNSSSQPYVSEYVEQATIVHELGHAFGLVNNGLPMVEAHHDSKNRAHCSNKKCVMYYQNEGSASMITFLMNSIIKGSGFVMFDNQCLQDAQKY